MASMSSSSYKFAPLLIYTIINPFQYPDSFYKSLHIQFPWKRSKISSGGHFTIPFNISILVDCLVQVNSIKADHGLVCSSDSTNSTDNSWLAIIIAAYIPHYRS